MDSFGIVTLFVYGVAVIGLRPLSAASFGKSRSKLLLFSSFAAVAQW